MTIDPHAHPPGEELAEFLWEQFNEDGTELYLDNWRDCGWSLSTGKTSGVLIAIMRRQDDASLWLAQVQSGIGWIGRLVGRSDREEQEGLTRILHCILDRSEQFTDIKWREGDFLAPDWTPTPD